MEVQPLAPVVQKSAGVTDNWTKLERIFVNLLCHRETCKFFGIALQGSSEEDEFSLIDRGNAGVLTSFNPGAGVVIKCLNEGAKMTVY